MELIHFAHFIGFGPETLTILLDLEAPGWNPKVKESVLSFFRLITIDDSDVYRELQSIGRDRSDELARKAGLEMSLATLPSRIFERYRKSVRNELIIKHGLSKPREELVYPLLCGGLSLDYSFVIRGAICTWSPQGNFGVNRIHNDHVAQDIKRMLLERGQRFDSFPEAYAAAKAKRWPGWELISEEDLELYRRLEASDLENQ